MEESIQACEWAPETVLLGKSGRHIKGISKSSFYPREKKAKAIILQLPAILPASGEWGSPGVRGVERLLRKMIPAGMYWNGWCPGDMGGTL